jgi:7-cyano-7-deazaguanine synthase in queuosine biosynthesis
MTTFRATLGAEEAAEDEEVLQVGKTLLTGEEELRQYVGGTLTSLESDLLRLASAVFAVDRAVPRGEGEKLARSLVLTVPVVNVGRLQLLASAIEDVLYRLSQDAWTIAFTQISGTPEAAQSSRAADAGKTLLFSGGADSLAAALEFGGNRLQLISHRTMNQVTIASQRNLVSALEKHGLRMRHAQILVSSRSGGGFEHAAEDSQRTRSFVFLMLGALAARRHGMYEIVYLAENGQMAIHLPLTQGRIGALSTHTAHPEVLVAMQKLMSKALAVDLKITNPYVYDTKAEVVKRIVETLKPALWLSNSCWRNARLSRGTHCGECIPCFVRKIAIEHHVKDKTEYARDSWSEDLTRAAEDDIARRNIADLGEFVVRFNSMRSDDIIAEWPELISEEMDSTHAISMYRRFAAEAIGVFAKYPKLKPFVS